MVTLISVEASVRGFQEEVNGKKEAPKKRKSHGENSWVAGQAQHLPGP